MTGKAISMMHTQLYKPIISNRSKTQTIFHVIKLMQFLLKNQTKTKEKALMVN